MGRSFWSDGGSDTWDIEIPSFDKASLYQTLVTEVTALFLPKLPVRAVEAKQAWKGKNTHSLKRSSCYLTRVSQICFTAVCLPQHSLVQQVPKQVCTLQKEDVFDTRGLSAIALLPRLSPLAVTPGAKDFQGIIWSKAALNLLYCDDCFPTKSALRMRSALRSSATLSRLSSVSSFASSSLIRLT